MALDPRTEKDLARFSGDVQVALRDRLICLAVYGSAAGEDWVAGRSDVNTVVVVSDVTLRALEALAAPVARRGRTLAVPLVVDPEYLGQATDTFPMELADIRDQHRVLAGQDVLGGLAVAPEALRRECEREARGKLLRLRALFLETAGRPAALEQVMVDSLKSFLVLLRHLLRLRDVRVAPRFADILTASEGLLGPLPAMRQLLAQREGAARLDPMAVRVTFGTYLGEVERIVATLDRPLPGIDA